LLFTIKQEDYNKIVTSEDISVIGYITEQEKGCKIITKGGSSHELYAQGWNAVQQ
jgi:thiamine-monophosphate kinase